MNTGTPPRAADGARLGAALTRRAALNAATRAYLHGEAVDMSALAARLGIGRTTLYRLVGNRDHVVAAGRGSGQAGVDGLVIGEVDDRVGPAVSGLSEGAAPGPRAQRPGPPLNRTHPGPLRAGPGADLAEHPLTDGRSCLE